MKIKTKEKGETGDKLRGGRKQNLKNRPGFELACPYFGSDSFAFQPKRRRPASGLLLMLLKNLQVFPLIFVFSNN